MAQLPVLRRSRSLLPDLADMMGGLPPIMTFRPMLDSHFIKVEDERTNGKYVVHAEMPGIDPAKDVEITVRDGLLTIKAERTEKSETKGRSEFSYGSFTRTVSLPLGADEEGIEAGYDKGILNVTIPVSESKAAVEKRIEVKTGS
jgi:HSP20 family molecular chaperone IbpA